MLQKSDRGPDGQRLGEITIGDFTERFPCHAVCQPIERMELDWRAQLRRLLDGVPDVALAHDPRFAWIIYREGPSCFVRQHLFLSGDFSLIPAREGPLDKDGHKISEWTTTAFEIERFLAA